MKKLLQVFIALVVHIYSYAAFADSTIFFGIQPTSLKVSFGARAQQYNLQFYIVNNVQQAQTLSDFALTPSTPNNLVTVTSFTNTCNGVIPKQGPTGVCNIFVKITARGIQTVGASVNPINYTFSLKYGARKIKLAANPFPISFANGSLTNATRTFTFNNKCNVPIWFGIASGATNSITPDPSTSPLDLQSCLTDSDCYPGSQCIQVQASPLLKHCFWINPAPSNGTYQLAATTGTNTVTFPVYDNGIDVIWSGGTAGRGNCTSGGCDTGDCGGGTGACPLGTGFSAPVSTAEFTLLNRNPLVYSNTPNGNTDVDTYDVTVINGVSTPVSMAPNNATWGGKNAPYTCGTPGHNLAQQSPLGACSWTFTPPSTTDYTWVKYVSSPTACTTDKDCTGSDVCGLSYNPAAPAGSQINKTCGQFLGYWTADAVCAKDPQHNTPPFTCPLPV